jgi:hypothetical protein
VRTWGTRTNLSARDGLEGGPGDCLGDRATGRAVGYRDLECGSPLAI